MVEDAVVRSGSAAAETGQQTYQHGHDHGKRDNLLHTFPSF